MNAVQIRSIIREELQAALAAFFVAPVPAAINQDMEDRLQHALRLPSLMAETQRQRAAAAERRARKEARRAA